MVPRAIAFAALAILALSQAGFAASTTLPRATIVTPIIVKTPTSNRITIPTEPIRSIPQEPFRSIPVEPVRIYKLGR